MIESRNISRRLAAALLALLLAALAGLAWAQPARAEYRGFADVSPTAWYVAGGWLDWAVDSGVMTGTKDPATQLPSGRFEPEGGVTRGQVATILYRMANPGSTATTVPSDYGASTSFTDVRTRYYYTAAIEWCYERGVVTGYRDPATQAATGRFGPEDPVTREQLATMLYRFATLVLGRDGSGSDAWASLPDAPSVQPFAREALSWCYAQGVMTGSVEPSGTFLRPREGATRAQAAKMAGAVMADGPAPDPADQEAWAVLYADGTLVFQRGGEPDPARGEVVERWTGFEDEGGKPWLWRTGEVTSVVTEGRISPVSISHWFEYMSKCVSIDLSGFDYSRLTRDGIAWAFSGCSSLVSLNITGWDAYYISWLYQDPKDVFLYCDSIQEVIKSDGYLGVPLYSASGRWYTAEGVRAKGKIPWEAGRYTSEFSQDPCCAILYSDGTLMLQRGLEEDGLHGEVVDSWHHIDSYRDNAPWKDKKNQINSIYSSGYIKMGLDWFNYMPNCTMMDLSGVDADASGLWKWNDMFAGCSSLQTLNIAGWSGGEQVQYMEYMFWGCSSLVELDLSDLKGGKFLRHMFDGCTSLTTIDIFDWKDVCAATSMFKNCTSLVSVNLSGWSFTTNNQSENLSGVSLSGMFEGCENLQIVNINGRLSFAETNVTDMFSGCSSLKKLNLSILNYSGYFRVCDAEGLFRDCSSLTTVDLSNIDPTGIWDGSSVFRGCSALNTIIVGDNWSGSFAAPSADDIPGATGLWYGPDGTGYRPADIPAGVAATYTALPPVAVAPSARPAGLEEAPVATLAFSLYPDGLLEVRPSDSGPSVPEEPAASWELPGDARLASAADAPWAEYVSQVLEVRVLDGVRPSSCAFWFAGMPGCAKFDLTGLDTSACSDFAGMFEGCDPAAEVVLGPLFSVAGDGTCAPCELPGVPEAPGADAATDEPPAGETDAPATDIPADAPAIGDSDPEEGPLPTDPTLEIPGDATVAPGTDGADVSGEEVPQPSEGDEPVVPEDPPVSDEPFLPEVPDGEDDTGDVEAPAPDGEDAAPEVPPAIDEPPVLDAPVPEEVAVAEPLVFEVASDEGEPEVPLAA